MSDMTVQQGSLVLYKNRPARVTQAGGSLEIELEDSRTVKVRPKDITLLHPGPLASLADLQPQSGEVETAWELLAGSTTSVAEVAELAYGEHTPPTAWAAWQVVTEGLYFKGTITEVVAHSLEEVERARAEREAKAAEAQAWAAFLERVRVGQTIPEDDRYLQDVEELALAQRTSSRVLQALNRPQTPERAHDLLRKLGRWDHLVNPHPRRLGVATTVPMAELLDLAEETRLDLTHLAAFAIDDEGSEDPDDAVSLHDLRLWVHVADVAALVPPDSPADLEARARGGTLYLPEGTVTMLPPKATQILGMGLQEVSPALSFGMDVNDQGEIAGIEIVPSWVRVTRLTYAEAEARLADPPLKELFALTQLLQARRRANNAVFIDFPEIKIHVAADQVKLTPLPSLKSRDLVAEAMLLAGEAAARFALDHAIPFPFTTQDAPEAYEPPQGLADMFALRKTLKRSQQTSVSAPHGGLGLPVYARATSPLRRYLDLVVHQQLRAYLRGAELLSEQAILARVGAAEAVTGSVRQAERLARKHWTLVYLLAHRDWCGEGILIDKRDRRGMVLIPALGLEISMHLTEDIPLDSTIPIMLNGISLEDLEAHFRVMEA